MESREAFFERVVAEVTRRVKLQAQQDPTFVPPTDDFSTIMAARTFASRALDQASSHRTLTFGTHLTSGGSSYDGTADVTMTPDATDAATANTLMARDANAYAALMRLLVGAVGFVGDTGNGTIDMWPAAAALIRFLDHTFAHENFTISDSGTVTARANVTAGAALQGATLAVSGAGAINGKTPVGTVAAPTGASGTYGASEQAAINDLILRAKNFGWYT